MIWGSRLRIEGIQNMSVFKTQSEEKLKTRIMNLLKNIRRQSYENSVRERRENITVVPLSRASHWGHILDSCERAAQQ